MLHHLSGSRHIVDLLHKLGFCSSYDEVKTFERSAALHQGVDLYGVGPGSSCIQFVADNVDHNLKTLDGEGTFHGMGIIGAATPGVQANNHIPRQASLTAVSVTTRNQIPIKEYGPKPVTANLIFEVLVKDIAKKDGEKADLSWKLSWPLRSPRPGWSGTMQTYADGLYPGQSCLTFLPMINMEPGNLTCIYSTLHFVVSLAEKYAATPILTFDQPLWWKAMSIVENEPADSPLRSIVLKLGGFHAEMGFLSSIGRLMAGSGLQELLEKIFAKIAVTHMLSGKAVARAVRGYFLVDSVLQALLSFDAFGFKVEIQQGRRGKETIVTDTTVMEENGLTKYECLQSALSLFDRMLQKDVTPQELQDSSELEQVESILQLAREKLKDNRTAALWLQFMDMVDLLRTFLRAERTGNWPLHLQTLQEMLPYYAAAGHNLFTKSVYIYLQKMQDLKRTHPDVHNQFSHGYHVLRRSDRFWAGVSSDLMIEQTLMKSVKSVGGLTRRRGMGETQRTQWLLSLPACSEVNRAMQEVCGLGTTSNDQHEDYGEARMRRDEHDMEILLNFVSEHNPFSGEGPLRSMCTGMAAGIGVNCDTEKVVGGSIFNSMNGTPVQTFKFRRSDHAVTMDFKTSAKLGEESIQVDPQLLFQRLVAVAIANPKEFDLQAALTFELSSLPASLFEPSGFLREAHKAELATSISAMVNGCQEHGGSTEDARHIVLDGGSLLHKVSWRKGACFADIFSSYADFVQRLYGSPIIVFDGYKCGPTTKDIAHLRRTAGAFSTDSNFSKSMVPSEKKEHFLSNKKNKQKFIDMLGTALEEVGCKIVHAKGDADTVIVETALRCASEKEVTVIGEDTDLLVLLCYHTKPFHFNVTFRSDKVIQNKNRVWHIQHVKGMFYCSFYVYFVNFTRFCTFFPWCLL